MSTATRQHPYEHVHLVHDFAVLFCSRIGTVGAFPDHARFETDECVHCQSPVWVNADLRDMHHAAGRTIEFVCSSAEHNQTDACAILSSTRGINAN